MAWRCNSYYQSDKNCAWKHFGGLQKRKPKCPTNLVYLSSKPYQTSFFIESFLHLNIRILNPGDSSVFYQKLAEYSNLWVFSYVSLDLTSHPNPILFLPMNMPFLIALSFYPENIPAMIWTKAQEYWQLWRELCVFPHEGLLFMLRILLLMGDATGTVLF